MFAILASSNCVSCALYQDINQTNGSLMLAAPMGSVINVYPMRCESYHIPPIKLKPRVIGLFVHERNSSWKH